MSEVVPGAVAPEATTLPGGQPVDAPGAPAAGNDAKPPEGEPEKQPRTLTEEEHNERVSKAVSERLAKERRRLERTLRAEIERDFLRSQIETGGIVRQSQKEEQPQKPRIEDYRDKSPEEYFDALYKYNRAQERKAEEQQAAERRSKAQDDEAERRAAAFAFEKIVKPGREKFKDFDAVVMEADGITDAMLAAAGRLKNGPDVLYQLAHNPDELARISSLSQVEQVWEIRALGEKAAATTSTPAPIRPNSASAAGEKDTSKMSFAEWEKWREGELAKQRAR